MPAFDNSSLVMTLLLSLRLAATFAMTPMLSSRSMPRVARVVLVLGLAYWFSLVLPVAKPPTDLMNNLGQLLSLACLELVLGASLGLGVQLALAAVTFAGRLLDAQVGFSLVQIFDPLSNVRASVITTIFDQLAVLLFFLLNIHHVLLRGFAWSVERFPPGESWALSSGFAPLLKQTSAMFVLGFALAAPVVLCILLVELALGVMSQSLPQMNMLMVGLPVKIVVGLFALALWVPEMGDAFSRIYQSIYYSWNEMLAITSGPTANTGGGGNG